MIDITDYLTLSQAAEALGYASRSPLSLYYKDGRIPGAIQRGTRWYIPRIWVLSERDNPTLAQQGGRGSSRKTAS